MNPDSPSPGLIRRLAAIFYDLCLLFAVCFVATALLLPFNAGEAFSGDQFFYSFYLLTVSFIFFGWFWTHGGQTLGMRSWKLAVLTETKQNISWKQALIRFICAILSWLPFGLGFWWVFFNSKKATWHDLASGSYLYLQRSGRFVGNDPD